MFSDHTFLAVFAIMLSLVHAAVTEGDTMAGHPVKTERNERCAAYSMYACLSFIDAPRLSVREIDGEFGQKGNQTSLDDCVRFAGKHDLLTAAYRWATIPSGFSLEDAPAIIPIVLNDGTGHFVAAVGLKDRRINNCRYVEDAASIRVNASSVGYDSC